MKRYTIELEGCDDTTTLIMDLTEDEASFLERIAKLSKETSDHHCMPTLLIEPTANNPTTPDA